MSVFWQGYASKYYEERRFLSYEKSNKPPVKVSTRFPMTRSRSTESGASSNTKKYEIYKLTIRMFESMKKI